MPISDILECAADAQPNALAVIEGDTHITFSQLRDESHRAANALVKMASYGDRVAILAQNVPEYVELQYAVPSVGMVALLLNYRLNPKEWVWILGNAEAGVLFVEQQFLEAVRPLLDEVTSLRHVVVIGEDETGMARSFAELKAAAPPTPPGVEVSEDDGACLIYTSGTTGFPKGAVITHRNLRAAALTNALDVDMKHGDRFLMSFPMCHASGFQTYQLHLLGSCMILMRSFEPANFLRLIEEHQITRTALAPTMATFVLSHPDLGRRDVSSVRVMSYGGMPMPLPTARALALHFGSLSSGFGQTESTLLVTRLTPDDHRRALAGEEYLLASCGRAATLAQVRVLDDEGRECPTGEVGELCVRSDLVMHGYWRDESGTAQALVDGWLHTGDLARRDAEGYFYLVDRKKDMLISGGQNIYPSEIEHVIYTVPAVAEVAVIGEADPVWGESITAVVVRRPGSEVTEDEIIAACADRLASYKKPKRVLFVDELPKTVTGKIQKRLLREWFGQPSAAVDRCRVKISVDPKESRLTEPAVAGSGECAIARRHRSAPWPCRGASDV